MHRVVVSPTAQKKLDKFPKKDRVRVLTALKRLEAFPYTGKKLEGEYTGSYSLRVWPYRVIYRILQKKLVVEVINIGHRQGIYQ